MPRGDLRKDVISWLRFGHAKRRPRSRGKDRRGKIPDMISIHDRPPEVEERLIPGHWEGDLIKGAHIDPPSGRLWNARPCTRFYANWRMPVLKPR